MSKYQKQLHAQVAESIERNLKNHLITQRHADGQPGRLWRCTNNGSAIYAFTIYAPPGWIMISGDMGECMWSRVFDMLHFVRGSAHSLHYFSEKASRHCVIEEVRKELAEEWLEEQQQEWADRNGEPMGQEQLEQLEEIREAYNIYEDPADLQRAIFESELYSGDTSSIPGCKYFTFHYLWQVEALKWLVAKLDAGEFTKETDFTWEKKHAET